LTGNANFGHTCLAGTKTLAAPLTSVLNERFLGE